MSRLLGGLFAAAVIAGCGGSDSPSSNSGANLANFQGSAWTVNLTTTVSCAGEVPVTSTTPTGIVFSPGSGADLQYTSTAGCVFKFNVSGNTATMSNGPVSCSTTVNGIAVTVSFTSYTVTSDGHHLTVDSKGTFTSGATSCPFAITGTGSR